MRTIYVLSDPRTPSEPVYVGQTTMRLRGRLRTHRSEARLRGLHRSRKALWVADLAESGLSPVIALLESLPEAGRDEGARREDYWIEVLRGAGYELLNTYKGGLAGDPRSKKTKAKISAANLGRKMTKAQHETFLAAVRAPEHRALLSSLISKQWEGDTERRAATAERSRGIWKNPEFRKAHVDRLKRRGKDPVARARLLARNRDMWGTPERKAALSQKIRDGIAARRLAHQHERNPA